MQQPAPASARFLEKIRHHFLLQIQKTFPEKSVPYAEALLFGEQTDFDDDVYQLYQRLGVVHLLAISGLHVQLVAGFCYYLFIRLGMTRERAAVCLLGVMPVYAVLCGMNPPVVRSAAMTMLLVLAGQKNCQSGRSMLCPSVSFCMG